MSHAQARSLSVTTATLSVAASMVGTGVFTTTGFLLEDLSPPAILCGWLLGGISALAGATAYAELGAAFPENGGEYALLRRVVHPTAGFLAGFVSVVVGFGAPVAACGMAFARYLRAIVALPVPDAVVAIGLIAACALAHARHVRFGTRSLVGVTFVQMSLCVGLALVGGAAGDVSRLWPAPGWTAELLSPPFAVSLVWISFSYAGWNAAAYLAGEVEAPGRTLPAALIAGTGFVTTLYVALNAAILACAPVERLRGEMAVAHVAAESALGPTSAVLLSGVVAFGLVGTVLALLLTGSRVAEAMGRDVGGLSFLAGRDASGSPVPALAVVSAIAVGFVATSAFDALVTFTGFVLSLFSMATVGGALWARHRAAAIARPFRVRFAPLVWSIYLVPTAWAVFQTCRTNPATLAAGLGLLAVAGAVWAWTHRRSTG